MSTKYTGKINGHPVEFEWDGKEKWVSVEIPQDAGEIEPGDAIIQSKWITDIKPVEPERPPVDLSKLEKKPDCEVSMDGENWYQAVFIKYGADVTGLPHHATTMGGCYASVWRYCRSLTPEPKKLEFPAPPDGRGWQNPDNLTPEQVEVDKGWRLKLKGETWDSPQTVNMLQEWDSRNSAWSKLNLPLQGWVDCSTYRTKHKLPVAEKEELEWERWLTSNRESLSIWVIQENALEERHEFGGDLYHIRKVKGKDATITKVGDV